MRDAAVKIGTATGIQWLIRHWDEVVDWLSDRAQDLT